MRKVSEVLRQYHELKVSHRSIAKSLNLGKTTVTRYLALAEAAGIRWPLPEGLSEEGLHHCLFMPTGKITNKKPLPDWETITKELRKKGVTLQLLWREYRNVHADGLGYSQFCEHYRAYLKEITPVMKQVHKGGEKTFVDYAGMKMPWIGPLTGEIHEAEIFVGCLGASQFIFVEATATQQVPDWVQSHVHMWEFFGGVSQVVVPDNLKTGVTKPHRYDPDINVNYQKLGEHYGFAIVPARVYEAKDKAKVENAVGIVERQVLAALRHMTFTSLAEINEAIRPRLAVLNNQLFQKMKTSRRELFKTVDRPALKPLPKDKYQYSEWKKAKVHIDYHFVLDDHYYSVPYQYIHKSVLVRATNKTVECFFQGKRISSHLRNYRRYQYSTQKEHMPKAHRVHADWSPGRIKRWANKMGPHTMQFIDHMIKSRAFPEQAYRACLGVLRLSTAYGPGRLEKACQIAFEAGATRYHQVELILKNKIDSVHHSYTAHSVVIAPHKNIRGPQYYK